MGTTDDTSPGKGSAKGRILVVEDHAAIRRLVAATLKANGFEVHEADRGDLAVAAAEAAGGVALRAVLLDLGLPGKSGLEVAEELKARWPSLPVIFMSGSTEFVGEDGVPGPGLHHLPKPFSPNELLQRLGEVLGG